MTAQLETPTGRAVAASELRSRPTVAWMGLIVLGVFGAAAILFATPWGAGLGGDSYYYVSGARNLLAGLGFSRPAADGGLRIITHYPPGYSTVLAVLTGLGLETLVAARWLDAVLFGVNIFLLGFMVYRVTRSAAPAYLAALLMLSSPALLVVHTWVLSEPLFLTFALLTLLALAGAAEQGRAWMILAAGLTAALGYLTRYVGLALIAAGGIALLGSGEGTVLRRLGRAAGFGVIAILGAGAWAARNLAVGGSLAYSAAQLHPPSVERLTEAAETISLWFLPNRIPFSFRAVGAAASLSCLVIVALTLLRRGGGDGLDRAGKAQAGILLCMALVYSIAIVGALTLVGSSIPLDDRILSPLLVALLGLGVLMGWAILGRVKRGSLQWWSIALVSLGFVVLMLFRGASTAWRLQGDGQGHAARAWQESALVDWVRHLPGGVPVYSNELDVLYLHTGRQAFQVPIRWDPVVEAPRDDYAAQLAAMRGRITDEGAVLVLFNTISEQQVFLPPEEELTRGLVEVFRASDGAAYAAGPVPIVRATAGRRGILW